MVKGKLMPFQSVFILLNIQILGADTCCFRLSSRPIALVLSAEPMPRTYTGRWSEDWLCAELENCKHQSLSQHWGHLPPNLRPPVNIAYPSTTPAPSWIISNPGLFLEPVVPLLCFIVQVSWNPLPIAAYSQSSGIASQFFLCPLVADSKDFPYNALFAAFVYRVSFLFSGFGCGVHE